MNLSRIAKAWGRVGFSGAFLSPTRHTVRGFRAGRRQPNGTYVTSVTRSVSEGNKGKRLMSSPSLTLRVSKVSAIGRQPPGRSQSHHHNAQHRNQEPNGSRSPPTRTLDKLRRARCRCCVGYERGFRCRRSSTRRYFHRWSSRLGRLAFRR